MTSVCFTALSHCPKSVVLVIQLIAYTLYWYIVHALFDTLTQVMDIYNVMYFKRASTSSHRATSTINGITYLPWSDSDLAELRKVTPLPQEFEDPNGLPQLSSKQRSSILNWMRPYDICDNPRMAHLISSFSIKQVMYSVMLTSERSTKPYMCL